MKSPAEAVAEIKAMQYNVANFIPNTRGYVDWNFSQVAAYLGYDDAVKRIESIRRWYDYQEKYKGICLLDKTYTAFLLAEAQSAQESTIQLHNQNNS